MARTWFGTGNQGSTKSMTLALVALGASWLIPSAHAWFPGVEQRFVDEKLIDTGSNGLPNTGLVAAFGDYNADQLLDLFYLSSDQRSLVVYMWNRSAYSWQEKPATSIRTSSDFIIVNVVPGDYNYDGRLDVLLMGSKNPNGWGWGDKDTLEMQVYLQQPDGSYGRSDRVESSGIAQPMPLDATGNMRTDLLGMTASGQHQLWQNSWQESNATSVFKFTDLPFKEPLNCRFPDPHFNAFIDLNGDCLADVFLTCQDSESSDRLSYQIWTNDKDGQFSLARKGDLPRGTKSVGFADMDRDGTIDMVITSCSVRNECYLQIAYNDQMPLCTGSISQSGPCRDPEALCVADDEFTFNLNPSDTNPAFTTVPIRALLPGSLLVTSSTAFRGQHPTPPAIGDYNVDGYPDILLLTSRRSRKSVSILQSRKCDAASCTPAEVAKKRRAFRVVVDGAEALTKIEDAESAHWIDMDDDGTLDILVQRSGNTGVARKQVFIKNNYFNDAFFLKALVLNGACESWCEPEERGLSRYRPYGVSYSGASYKFTVLDPSGARRSTQYGQLPQSTYLSLGTPYSFFGLGRTNNYVENLFIGSTRHQAEHFINIEGLIPNSQVVIVPYQPDDVNDPSTWTKELYLHPGDWIPWVTIVLGAAIMGLGIVVVVLQINEKRADEAERRARLLSLNVRAL